MTEGLLGVREFLRDERGTIYGSTSYMIATMAISIPLGLILYSVYDALCDAGRYANYVIGLF